MAGRGQNTFTIFRTVVERGRGLFNTDGVVRSRATVLTREEPFKPDDFTDTPPLEPLFSTPAVSSDDTAQLLCVLIGALGSQRGESIASWLLASQPTITQQQPPWTNLAWVEAQDTTIGWLSKVSLVVKPDIMELPIHSGDRDDKYSIQDWIDMMEAYLQERLHEQSDEIISHLLGRARSIFQVGLKSSSSSGAVVHPETITYWDIISAKLLGLVYHRSISMPRSPQPRKHQ